MNIRSWFQANEMFIYTVDRHQGVNSIANGVTLRSDILGCLDRSSFVFYPFGDGRYGGYVLKQESDYVEWVHRRPARVHPRVADQYLYARFAYNVIGLVLPQWSKPDRCIPAPQYVQEINRQSPRERSSAGLSPTSSELEFGDENESSDAAGSAKGTPIVLYCRFGVP